MKVAVLGCGPAGLMAAWAAEQCGHSVTIFSKPRKSEMFGAQYLHAPIPGMTESAPVPVRYELQGTIEGYRRKVYGDNWQGKVSPDEYGDEANHDAWDIRTTYGNLWQHFGRRVLATMIDAEWIDELVELGHYDHIFSTVPAPLLCAQRGNPSIYERQHVFTVSRIWAIGDAPERGIMSPIEAPRNTILCNGDDWPAWYRVSNVFGYHTAEYPYEHKPPIKDVAEVQKPLETNCDCFPGVTRLGRYGQWKKGVLSHEAYQEAMAACATATV